MKPYTPKAKITEPTVTPGMSKEKILKEIAKAVILFPDYFFTLNECESIVKEIQSEISKI